MADGEALAQQHSSRPKMAGRSSPGSANNCVRPTSLNRVPDGFQIYRRAAAHSTTRSAGRAGSGTSTPRRTGLGDAELPAGLGSCPLPAARSRMAAYGDQRWINGSWNQRYLSSGQNAETKAFVARCSTKAQSPTLLRLSKLTELTEQDWAQQTGPKLRQRTTDRLPVWEEPGVQEPSGRQAIRPGSRAS